MAPIIHEWTYEAMAYDLLNLTSNTFCYESETAGGKMESKEHILDERDELWVSACTIVDDICYFAFDPGASPCMLMHHTCLDVALSFVRALVHKAKCNMHEMWWEHAVLVWGCMRLV